MTMVVSEQPSKKRKSCPPINSDQPVALEGRLEGESLHFLRSMWLWMSPLCSRLAIFYKAPRPGRQKIAASSIAAQNICIFCGQCGCGCRHSAAVWPISIVHPALGDKKWLPILPLRRTMRKYADKRDVDVAILQPFGQFL